MSRWRSSALPKDPVTVLMAVAGVRLVALWLLGSTLVTLPLDDISYPTENHFTKTQALKLIHPLVFTSRREQNQLEKIETKLNFIKNGFVGLTKKKKK